MRQFEYGFYSETTRQINARFGTLFDLPIVENPYTEIKEHYSVGNLLDIGAGKDKPLLELIQPKLDQGAYFSLDDDPQGTFDFKSVQDIPQEFQFSLVAANQFFEHLGVQDSIDIVANLKPHLTSGAKFIATVPNISHPNRYWGDITHKTHWNFHNLALPFRYSDLEIVKIARYSKRHPRGPLEKLIARYVSRIYRMDWCDSIIMIAQNNG